jgi:hypothetical protein
VGCGSLRLGGARPAGRDTRTDRPLVLSGGQASCCELEPMVLSHTAACGWRDDDTSVLRGGDDEDDPNMSL